MTGFESVNVLSVKLPTVSDARIVNVKLAVEEDVPDNKPVDEFKLIPVGSVPDCNVYVMALSSVADRAAE